MKLIEYEGKKVRIVSVNNRIFEGTVSDYIYPDEDDTGLESIVLNCKKGSLSGHYVEFWEADIKTIEIIG